MSVSHKRLYLNMYCKIANRLLQKGGSLYGNVVVDYILPKLWPVVKNPFSPETIEDDEENMYNLLRDEPLRFTGITGTTLQIDEYDFAAHDTFDVTYVTYDRATPHIRRYVERVTKDVTIKVDVIVDVMQIFDFKHEYLLYSAVGITSAMPNIVSILANATSKRTTSLMMLPLGVDAHSISIKKEIASKIIRRVARGWLVDNCKFSYVPYERGFSGMCIICQDEIQHDHVEYMCTCRIHFHPECAVQYIASEFEKRHVIRCPGCRREQDFYFRNL